MADARQRLGRCLPDERRALQVASSLIRWRGHRKAHDLGCSINSARICELYQADDRAFNAGYKTVGTGLAATVRFIASRTATAAPLYRRAAAIGHILKNGDAIAQDLIVSRCTRGADIARSLRFSGVVSDGIYHLDEHWDGSGRTIGSGRRCLFRSRNFAGLWRFVT